MGDVQADKSGAGGRLTRVLAAMEKWLGIGQKKACSRKCCFLGAGWGGTIIKYRRELLV